MPEASMLLLDNSEYMRNGDFTPTRWANQTDASLIVFDAKTNDHPESEAGVMTMAGKGPQVLATLDRDAGRLLKCINEASISGEVDVATSINIAQLALKHRQNKVQSQRIIVFVGSPVHASEEELTALGKKLKKNNVAVDIINFGEGPENESRLRVLVDNANSGDNSHLLTVEAGSSLLSDVVISSAILMGGGGGGGGAGGSGGDGGFEFGVDPSMDPELAMALRMSLEEEQARQRGTQAAAAGGSQAPASASSSSAAPPAAPATAPEQATSANTTAATAPPTGLPSAGSLVASGADAISGSGPSAHDDSEAEMLRRAMELSQQGGVGQHDDDGDVTMTHDATSASAAAPTTATTAAAATNNQDQDEEMTEEEAIARAIQMSLQDGAGDDKGS